jgi:large conductance mechanosensitive channel
MVRSTFNEFKQFIARGNVMDLAVGIIIGAAFTAIVNSLVQDLINPLIGLFTGGIDFSNLFFPLSTESYPSVAAAEAAGVAVFRYGSFITAVINFLIIAWVVFLLVKGMNKLRASVDTSEKAPDAPKGPTQEELLAEIRDLLRKDVEGLPVTAQPKSQSPA